jgi:hypothetical protein
MSRIRPIVVLLFLATSIWLSGTSESQAKPKAAPVVTNVDSIRHFMEKGQSLFLGGQPLRAAEIFDAGYELHPYSAFLFNAGVALEKGGKLTEAVEHFRKYLEVDPKAPDSADVKKRIERVEQLVEEQRQAARENKPPQETPKAENETDMATKSLVVIETEPAGAPLRIFRRMTGDTLFDPRGSNPDWSEIVEGKSPTNASLDVGQYHVVVDRFEDNNPGDTSFEVLAGHVLQVKVNLSQGQFMAHLRLTSNVEHAKVYLDDPKREKEPWGKTPLSDFLPAGDHVLVVAATGYAPVKRKVSFARAEQQELRVELERLDVGSLRVSSNVDGTQITLDGKPAGEYVSDKPPIEITNLSAGAHFIRLTARGRKTLETEISIPKGQALPVTAHLVVTPPRGAAWTQAIVGGVLLGGGLYLGLESNRLYDELKRDRNHGTLANDDSRVLRGKLFSIGADVAFLGGAIFGGLSTYNFLSDPLPPSRLVLGRAVEFDTPNAPTKVSRPPTTKPSTKRTSRSGFVPWSAPETVQ